MMIDLIITLKMDDVKDMTSLVERFQQQGLSVSNVTDYGVIMGRGDKSLIPKLSQQKEVESVMQDYYTQLPPPHSDIQ